MHWIDPQHLPEVDGVVARFLVNPHAEVDGLLLEDGLEVHVPPHLGVALRARLRVGEQVRVRGVRPRAAAMISAVALRLPDGELLVDEGPSHPKKERPRPAHADMTASGQVTRLLHGPKGEPRGALLDDGTILRWPPHAEVDRKPGSSIAASGRGVQTADGRVIDVSAVGAQLNRMQPLDTAAHHEGPEKPHAKRRPKPHEKH